LRKSPNGILKNVEVFDKKGSKLIDGSYSVNISTFSTLIFDDTFWSSFVNISRMQCKNDQFEAWNKLFDFNCDISSCGDFTNVFIFFVRDYQKRNRKRDRCLKLPFEPTKGFETLMLIQGKNDMFD